MNSWASAYLIFLFDRRTNLIIRGQHTQQCCCNRHTHNFSTQGSTSTDREGDKFQYLSPDYKGLRLAAGFQLKGSDEDENMGDSDKAAFFGGAEYTLGAVKIAFVYDSLDNYDGDVTGRQNLDANGNVTGSFDAGDQFGLSMQYKPIDDLRLAFKIEQYNSENTDFVADEARYALSARYHYGPGNIYGTYQFVDVDRPLVTNGWRGSLAFEMTVKEADSLPFCGAPPPAWRCRFSQPNPASTEQMPDFGYPCAELNVSFDFALSRHSDPQSCLIVITCPPEGTRVSSSASCFWAPLF